MNEVFAPLETEFVEQQRKHLEMIVLFVADHVNHTVNREIAVAQLGRAYVLGHIHARAVGAEQQLVVKTVGSEVGPYRTVLLAVHYTLFKASEHQVLAFKISVRLVIYLVEVHAHASVSLVEAGIHPLVHHLPQRPHLLVALFPAAEHLAGLLHQRTQLLGFLLFNLLLLHDGFHLILEMLVESHIEIAYEVVALLPGRFRSSAFAPLFPGKHRLAYVYAAVVDDICLDHPVAVGLKNLRHGISEKIVAHMAKMERLVGVWRRILHHDERRILRGLTEAETVVSCD